MNTLPIASFFDRKVHFPATIHKKSDCTTRSWNEMGLIIRTFAQSTSTPLYLTIVFSSCSSFCKSLDCSQLLPQEALAEASLGGAMLHEPVLSTHK